MKAQILLAGAIIALSHTAISLNVMAQDVVDATSLNNKVMAGYQGWFRTPGDRPENNGWAHVFNGNSLTPAKLAFDTWPDMSELSKDEKYPVPGFTYPDGRQADFYSAQNPKTVLRHFKWMKQYGIDGVWLSEFCGHFPGAKGESDTTALLQIMRNVRSAATATGRTWAFMWDMSGLPGPLAHDVILNQWKKMVDQGITSDPRYLHHDGKPVLLIWGFFPGRPGTQPVFCKSMVDFLEAPGKYQAALVGGVDPNWRALGSPEFQAMLMSMTAIQPWSVGRVVKDPSTYYKIQNTSLWAGDIEKCKANNVIFIPVFNSGTHVAGPPPNPPAIPVVPRRTGNYLWEQFVAAAKTGTINSAFIAMFDEINEGTQIMKIENNPPVQAPFLTYDGATSDYYLRLVGLGAKMLKSHTPISNIIPISPFDEHLTYLIKNKMNSAGLSDTGKWHLIYDGKGYFKLKNTLTGKILIANGAAVNQAKDNNNDDAKWHLEWDGTGYCRIINKNVKKAIISTGIKLSLVTDTAVDVLRWKITQQ